MKLNIALFTAIIIGSLNNFSYAMHTSALQLSQQAQRQSQQQALHQKQMREARERQQQEDLQRQRDSAYLLQRQAEYQELYGKK